MNHIQQSIVHLRLFYINLKQYQSNLSFSDDAVLLLQMIFKENLLTRKKSKVRETLCCNYKGYCKKAGIFGFVWLSVIFLKVRWLFAIQTGFARFDSWPFVFLPVGWRFCEPVIMNPNVTDVQ